MPDAEWRQIMENGAESKALSNYDQSGFEFTQELLSGEATAAINFDRIQKHPEKGYIIFEYLLCEEAQQVTPYSSHPNRYWHKNRTKFLSLWRVKLALGATLYLVNYAKKGTAHENEVKTIEVTGVTYNGLTGPETNYTREQFKEWFRDLIRQSLMGPDTIFEEICLLTPLDSLEATRFTVGMHKGKSLKEIESTDRSYLEWASRQSMDISPVVRAYLRKKDMQLW